MTVSGGKKRKISSANSLLKIYEEEIMVKADYLGKMKKIATTLSVESVKGGLSVS